MQLVIFFLSLAFMFVFDVVGSVSTANYTEQSYQDFRATNSKEFELLTQNAESGKSELSIYSQELTAYQQNKRDAYQVCSEKWKGWKAKYKAKCKNQWNRANPTPTKPNSSTTVKVDDYKSVKNDTNGDFLSKYIFYIILFLSLALTMLLQYTTVSQILENHEDIDETLTDEVIGILQDRISELETNMIQHETQRNELISDSDREHKANKRQFEKLGKAIQLLSLNKAVDARGATVQRIANNETMPTTNKKAGFVRTPFSSNQQNQEQSQPLTKDVLFDRLFKGKTSEQKLNPKPNVININKRSESQLLSSVYKRLLSLGIAELRGNQGYYSLIGYESALKRIKIEGWNND